MFRNRVGALLLILLASTTTGFTASKEAIQVEWIDRIWFSHLLKRAQDLRENPVFSEAFFREAFRLNPRSADVVEALARSYAAQGEDAMASMSITYGKLLDPKRAYWKEMDAALWEAVAKLPLRPDLTDDAKANEARFSKDFEAARAAWDAKNFMNMEIARRRQLVEYPRHPQLLLELGGCYAVSQDWPMYTLVYGYFHRLHSNNLDVANNYCIGLEKVGQYRTALDVLKPFLEKNKDSGYLLENCSRFAEMAGMQREAESYAKQWVDVTPENVQALTLYGKALIRRKDFRDARPWVEKANTLEPANPVCIMLLAHLHAGLGNEEAMTSALRDLKSKIDPAAFRNVLVSDPFKGKPDALKLMETP